MVIMKKYSEKIMHVVFLIAARIPTGTPTKIAPAVT